MKPHSARTRRATKLKLTAETIRVLDLCDLSKAVGGLMAPPTIVSASVMDEECC
jgi:hypothetical protein